MDAKVPQDCELPWQPTSMTAQWVDQDINDLRSITENRLEPRKTLCQCDANVPTLTNICLDSPQGWPYGGGKKPLPSTSSSIPHTVGREYHSRGAGYKQSLGWGHC